MERLGLHDNRLAKLIVACDTNVNVMRKRIACHAGEQMIGTKSRCNSISRGTKRYLKEICIPEICIPLRRWNLQEGLTCGRNSNGDTSGVSVNISDKNLEFTRHVHKMSCRSQENSGVFEHISSASRSWLQLVNLQ